jgi:hypothetical protein
MRIHTLISYYIAFAFPIESSNEKEEANQLFSLSRHNNKDFFIASQKQIDSLPLNVDIVIGQLTGQRLHVVAAIIFIIAGILTLFAGQQLIKPVLFAVGFIIFGRIIINEALLSNALVQFIIETYSISLNETLRILTIVLIAIGGFIGGSVLYIAIPVASYVFGGTIGFYFGKCFSRLPLIAQLNPTVKNTFVFILVISGIFISIPKRAFVIILGTSIFGSYLLFIGVDNFVQSNFGVTVLGPIISTIVQPSPLTVGMVGGFVLFTTFGVYTQWQSHKFEVSE